MSKDVIKKSVVERYQPLIIQIFEKYLKGEEVEVYIYGSRARGTEDEVSDIDIAVKSRDLSAFQFSQLKELFSESNIPYKIDLIDWSKASRELKDNIRKEGVLIWVN